MKRKKKLNKIERIKKFFKKIYNIIIVKLRVYSKKRETIKRSIKPEPICYVSLVNHLKKYESTSEDDVCKEW